MKSILAKVIAPLFLALFVFGIAQYADAAFPGKQEQSKTVIANHDSNSSDLNKQNTPTKSSDDDLVLLVILAILIPPLAVYLKYNELGKPFIINVILTLLCGLPGVIHALYHVLKK